MRRPVATTIARVRRPRAIRPAPAAPRAARAPLPPRPACMVEGCALGDCPTCRYIDALELHLGAEVRP